MNTTSSADNQCNDQQKSGLDFTSSQYQVGQISVAGGLDLQGFTCGSFNGGKSKRQFVPRGGSSSGSDNVRLISRFTHPTGGFLTISHSPSVYKEPPKKAAVQVSLAVAALRHPSLFRLLTSKFRSTSTPKFSASTAMRAAARLAPIRRLARRTK